MSSVIVNCNKSRIHVKGVSIIYFNACSLLYELRAVSEATMPDIICIVETWLDNDVSDDELFLSNYQLFRLDRSRHGGGIAIYVCNALSKNLH